MILNSLVTRNVRPVQRQLLDQLQIHQPLNVQIRGGLTLVNAFYFLINLRAGWLAQLDDGLEHPAKWRRKFTTSFALAPAADNRWLSHGKELNHD